MHQSQWLWLCLFKLVQRPSAKGAWCRCRWIKQNSYCYHWAVLLYSYVSCKTTVADKLINCLSAPSTVWQMWSCQNFVFTCVCCKCAGTRNEPWTFKIHQSASISHPHQISTHSWDENELVIKKKLNGQCIGSHFGAACSNVVFAHPPYTQEHNSDFKPTVVDNHCVLEVVTQSHKTQ